MSAQEESPGFSRGEDVNGNGTPAVEVPVAVLALAHLLLYVREANAVGAHADMDTVDYFPQGSVLGYDRKP